MESRLQRSPSKDSTPRQRVRKLDEGTHPNTREKKEKGGERERDSEWVCVCEIEVLVARQGRGTRLKRADQGRLGLRSPPSLFFFWILVYFFLSSFFFLAPIRPLELTVG